MTSPSATTLQPPVATNDSYITYFNQSLAVPALTGVLVNDSDPNGLPLTAVLIGGTSNGALTLNPDGSFKYLPNGGYVGTDSFTYQASEGTVSSSTATVTITVATKPPTANSDSYNTNANQTLMVPATTGVLVNDSDPQGYPLTAGVVTGPSHGTLNFNPDGSFNYTPNQGFAGTDSFTYDSNNGYSNSATPGTVTLTVTGEPPVANSDSYNTNANQALTVPAVTGVLANDSDPQGNPLTAVVATQPSNGTLTLNPDGSFDYTPNQGFAGTDTFTYDVNDGYLTSTTPGTATITVAGQPPVVNNESYNGNAGQTLIVPAETGVLANDSDPQGNSLTAVVATQPSNGTLTLNPDGSFNYTPNQGFVGTDSFTYNANDGYLTSATPATVTLTITTQPPLANNDSYSGNAGQALTVTAAQGVLANDTDPNGYPLTAGVVSGTSNGTLTFNPDGSFNYTPNQGFAGTDSFTYEANDGISNSNPATVTITVTNQPPVANNDTYVTYLNQTLGTSATTGVLANDKDPNGDPLTAGVASGPSHGTLNFNPDGSFTYTPNQGYVGTDSFTYEASDGFSNSNPATVKITVLGPIPIANNDIYSTGPNKPLIVPVATGVLANDSDSNGQPLTATLVNKPSNGTLTLNSDGSFNYNPNTGYTGTDSFTYVANDGTSTSNPATVTLTIGNQPPVANNESYNVATDVPLNVPSPGVLANDTDPQGFPLTATVVTNPSNGTLNLNSNGSFSYTPNSGYTGTDSFTYNSNDGYLNSTTPATVTLTIGTFPPTANNDSYNASPNQSLAVTSTNGVLANDTNVAGLPLTVSLVSSTNDGSLKLNPDGSFTYTPNTGFIGTDIFTYQATDGTLTSSTATVAITVGGGSGVAALSAPVERFYNGSNGEHVYTASPSEQTALATPSSGFANEGVSWYASLTSQTGLVAVNRYYNTTTGDHFLTASTSEQDVLHQASSGYQAEGVAFYAYPAGSGIDSPIDRFFNPQNGQHLYTGNQTEIASLPSIWQNEGPAFNAVL